MHTQLEHDRRLGELLRERPLADGVRLENRTLLPVVCFADAHRHRPRAVAGRAVGSGEAWLSATTCVVGPRYPPRRGRARGRGDRGHAGVSRTSIDRHWTWMVLAGSPGRLLLHISGVDAAAA